MTIRKLKPKNLTSLLVVIALIFLAVLLAKKTVPRPAEIPNNFTSYQNKKLGINFWYPKEWGKVEVNDASTMTTLTFSAKKIGTFQFNKTGALGRGGTPADDLIKFAGNAPSEYPATESIELDNGKKVSIWLNYDPCWDASPRERKNCEEFLITPLPAAASTPLASSNYEAGMGVYITDHNPQTIADFRILMRNLKLLNQNSASSTMLTINDTKDWKTYSNNTPNFQFRYPPEWQQKPGQGDIIVWFKKGNREFSESLQIRFVESDKSPAQFAQAEVKESQVPGSAVLRASENDALYVTYGSLYTEPYTYVRKTKNGLLIFDYNYDPKYESSANVSQKTRILEEIASTVQVL